MTQHRLGLISFILTSAVWFFSSLANANDLLDPESKCRIEGERGVTHIKWDGECVAGRISGAGRLEFYNGDTLVWYLFLNPSSGAIAQNGKIHIDVRNNISRINSHDKNCRQLNWDGQPGGRWQVQVDVQVAKGTEIETLSVRNAIYKIVRDTIIQGCPYFDRFPIVARLIRIGDPPDRFGQLGAPFVLAEIARDRKVRETNLFNRRQEEIIRINAELRNRKQSEVRRQQAENTRLQFQAEQERVRKIFSDYQISALVPEEKIRSNVFLYENKVVAILGRLSQMVSRSDALISDSFLISGVPRPDIFPENARGLVIMKGLEMGSMEGRKVITGKFVGFFACRNSERCQEYWDYIKR